MTAMSPSPRRFGAAKSRLLQNAARVVQHRQLVQGVREGAATFQPNTGEPQSQDGGTPVKRRGRGLRTRHNFQAPLRVT